MPAVEAAGFEARLAPGESLRTGPADAPDGTDGSAGGSRGELRLSVEGMTCASCSGAVRRALEVVPGVQSAAVSLATNSAIVRLMPAQALSGAGDATDGARQVGTRGAITLRHLVQVVEAAGFEAGPAGGSSEERLEAAAREHNVALWGWASRLAIAACLAVPVFVLSMIPMDTAAGRVLYRGCFGLDRLPVGHVV